MAQNISIVKVNEHGVVLSKSEINFAPIQKVLSKITNFKEKFPMLSSIDEYGNTSFNRIQLPRLIKELSKSQNLLIGHRDIIYALVKFIEDFNIHEYLEFIGD